MTEITKEKIFRYLVYKENTTVTYQEKISFILGIKTPLNLIVGFKQYGFIKYMPSNGSSSEKLFRFITVTTRIRVRHMTTKILKKT